MTVFGQHRLALSITAAAALLAGCGALRQAQDDTQPPIGVPGATAQSRATATSADRSGSWMLPGAAREDLLYVSAEGYNGTGIVLVLSYPQGKLVGTLTGFDVPLGECVGTSGNVFITDPGAKSIIEYAHGGKDPIATLSDPSEPYGCSVDATTGNLAAANFSDNVAIYPGAQGSPTLYSDPSIYEYEFCAYDSNGNLFVDGTTDDLIAELPKGSTSFRDITFDREIAGPGSLQWVNGGLVIVDAGALLRSPTPVDRVRISGSSGTVIGKTYLKSHDGAIAGYVQYWIQGRQIVGPERNGGDGHKFFGFWRYPAGGTPTQTLRHLNSGDLWGTVLSLPKK